MTRTFEAVVFVALWTAIVLTLEGCKSPELPYYPDASPDGSCQVLDEISAARLVRTPDGSSLVVHCIDGGAP